MDCAACNRIVQIRRGEFPDFIAELSESFVVLGDEQFYRGWCILFLKDHHEHLASLPIERQRNLWSDVTRVADAIKRVTNPSRINYECLGNQLHHIHWHVIPRYVDDPDPTAPVWLRSTGDRAGSMTKLERQDMILRVSEAIRISPE